MTDAEQKRHKVPKYTDDVALVPLPTDDHVVFQDVDLGSWLNLGLGENFKISFGFVFDVLNNTRGQQICNNKEQPKKAP